MKEVFELVEFKSLNSEGDVVLEYTQPLMSIESNENGLRVVVKQNDIDTSTPVSFFMTSVISSCRLGNKGYVFNFHNHFCHIITFKVKKDTQVFNSLIKGISECDTNEEKSMFTTRTEEASATQYFQFYGYLSQQQNMLQDYVRTSTYEKAVLANIEDFQGKIILDVGAGSGILSFFSAQAGAERVYAIEASSMAEHAEKLVACNRRSDKIIIITGKVEEVTIPEEVDMIISEPMGYMLYNERMLETYLHAKKWLKKDTGKMFPTLGDLHVSPFTDEALFMEQTQKASFWLQTHFHNVDLSSLHDAAVAEYFRQPIVDTFDIRICTAKPVKHTVNFLEADEVDLHKIEIPLEFTCLQTSTIHGLAFWFDVAFIGSAQTIWLSTSPTEPLTHWYQVRCLFSTPIFAKINDKLTGKVLLEANPRQSYEVTIDLMVDGAPTTRSQNTLDLKNPYFRYTGGATAPPPGTNNVSPSDSYWNQMETQIRTAPDEMVNIQPTFDIGSLGQWSNQTNTNGGTVVGGGQIHMTNALNNTVNMVNDISLNGYAAANVFDSQLMQTIVAETPQQSQQLNDTDISDTSCKPAKLKPPTNCDELISQASPQITNIFNHSTTNEASVMPQHVILTEQSGSIFQSNVVTSADIMKQLIPPTSRC